MLCRDAVFVRFVGLGVMIVMGCVVGAVNQLVNGSLDYQGKGDILLR